MTPLDPLLVVLGVACSAVFGTGTFMFFKDVVFGSTLSSIFGL